MSEFSRRKDKQRSVTVLRRQFVLSKKVFIITSGIAIIAISAVVFIGISLQSSGQSTGTNRSVASPQYPTVVPDGKTIEDLGGWKRVSPPKNDPVYAFNDKIDDVAISVSQQPVPKSFKGDATNKVADLAKNFNATNKVNADDTVVYVGTSSKGPQSVIFMKKDVLVLIKSEKKIENTAWANYIKTLHLLDADAVPNY